MHPVSWARIRRKPGEPRANSADGVSSLAIRTHQDGADIMGLSRQRVQQIERIALWKLRRALLADYQDFTNHTPPPS
jgi:hypothetical protein